MNVITPLNQNRNQSLSLRCNSLDRELRYLIYFHKTFAIVQNKNEEADINKKIGCQNRLLSNKKATDISLSVTAENISITSFFYGKFFFPSKSIDIYKF